MHTKLVIHFQGDVRGKKENNTMYPYLHLKGFEP